MIDHKLIVAMPCQITLCHGIKNPASNNRKKQQHSITHRRLAAKRSKVELGSNIDSNQLIYTAVPYKAQILLSDSGP